MKISKDLKKIDLWALKSDRLFLSYWPNSDNWGPSSENYKEKTPKSDKAKIVFLLKTLGFDLKTKEEVEKKVNELASLELSDKNYGEIVDRLEILVKEQQEYDNSEV